MFLTSLGSDREDQRFNKATIYLRTLVFGRLSDDHVVALAVLHELSDVYRRAYGTAQVINPVPYGSQEQALRDHLRALGLPCGVEELEPHEVQSLVNTWKTQSPSLPRPFDEMLRSFVAHAEAQLSTVATQASGLGYQTQ